MIDLLARRVGTAIKFSVMTMGFIAAHILLSVVIASVKLPDLLSVVAGVVMLVAWINYVFRPMMRTAADHAREEREIKIETNMRLGMADYERGYNVAQRIKNEQPW